VLVEIQT